MSHHSTSHHSTSHHYCTTFHITYYIPHVPRNISHLMSQHISPQTTIFYIWHHITLQSSSNHHFTPPHFKAQHSTSHSHSPHLTPFIPQPQLFHTTPTFNVAVHIPHHITPPRIGFTSRYHIWHHNTLHHFPHLTSTSTLHMPHSSSPQCYTTTVHVITPHLALCNIPHTRTPHSPTPYSTSHILNFSYILHHPISEIATFHIASHFASHRNSNRSTTSWHTIPHHSHVPPSINCTSHYPTLHITHCILTIILHRTMS